MDTREYRAGMAAQERLNRAMELKKTVDKLRAEREAREDQERSRRKPAQATKEASEPTGQPVAPTGGNRGGSMTRKPVIYLAADNNQAGAINENKGRRQHEKLCKNKKKIRRELRRRNR